MALLVRGWIRPEQRNPLSRLCIWSYRPFIHFVLRFPKTVILAALLNLGVLCDLFLGDLGCALSNYSRYSEIVVDDPDVGIWISDVENRMRQAGAE